MPIILEFKPENDLNSWPLNGDSLSQEIKSLTLGLMLRRRQDGALFFTCTRLDRSNAISRLTYLCMYLLDSSLCTFILTYVPT